MSSLIDSGADLVLSSNMVCFSRSFEQRKQIYSFEANSLGVVWCSYNEWTNRLCVYRRLLTNRLHGKAAELCLDTFFSKLRALLADQRRRRKASDG